MVTQITPLRAELAKLVGEHREIELNLRSKKFRMETEVENWLTKYDDVSLKYFKNKFNFQNQRKNYFDFVVYGWPTR